MGPEVRDESVIFERPIFRPMGDRALLIQVGEGIHPVVNRKVREIFLALARNPIAGVRDMVPSYRSLMIVFDPLLVSSGTIERRLLETYATVDLSPVPHPRTIEVPVAYGGEWGPDLEWVAHYHGIPPEEVIRLHSETLYQVYMIGFSPGFPYLGELPEVLITPRRETPRLNVAKGSVGIAQRQTGIYSVSGPGGWQILGRTPLSLFDAMRSPPALMEMGDLVKFVPLKETTASLGREDEERRT